MRKFRNSGEYLGGGTVISRVDKSWFSKGGTQSKWGKRPFSTSATEPPPRSLAEQAEFEAFESDYYKVGEQKLIKRDSVTPSEIPVKNKKS